VGIDVMGEVVVPITITLAVVGTALTIWWSRFFKVFCLMYVF